LGTLSSYSGITDANGDIQIRVKAPDVAGTHTITANCGVCANPTVSANIDVKVPGLLPISPISPRKQDGSYVYALTSVDHTHAGNGRYHRNQYYLTDFSRKNLRTLIDAFFGIWLGHCGLERCKPAVGRSLRHPSRLESPPRGASGRARNRHFFYPCTEPSLCG
jgi:hypothetical protein